MDRRSLMKHAGIAGVLAAGVAPAVHAQAAVRWRLASSFPKSLDTIFGSAEMFAKTVRALSGGKFEVSVHAAGELMPAFGVVDGIQNGTIEMAQTASYYFTGKDSIFGIGDHGRDETEALDAASQLLKLCRAVEPGVIRIRF